MQEYKDYYGYKVSNLGHILTRKTGKPFSRWENGRGYLVINCTIHGKSKTVAVHRIVALCWVENPDGHLEVNHKDGNKQNNNAENLEWCSRGYNIKHAYDNNLRSARGENNSRCLITEEEVIKIANLLSEGHTSAAIRDMGYDYTRVRSIKSRQNWGWLTKDYVW